MWVHVMTALYVGIPQYCTNNRIMKYYLFSGRNEEDVLQVKNSRILRLIKKKIHSLSYICLYNEKIFGYNVSILVGLYNILFVLLKTIVYYAVLQRWN